MPEHSEPQKDRNLPGNAQQEDLPCVKVQKDKQGQEKTQNAAPHNKADEGSVPPEIVPCRPQAQQHDAVGGDGVDEGQPGVGKVKAG